MLHTLPKFKIMINRITLSMIIVKSNQILSTIDILMKNKRKLIFKIIKIYRAIKNSNTLLKKEGQDKNLVFKKNKKLLEALK